MDTTWVKPVRGDSARDTMMPAGRSLECRKPSSPGSTCVAGSVAKISLLGQQFTHSSAHQSPSSSHSSTIGFSLGTHLQPQPSSSQALSYMRTQPQQQVSPSHRQSQTGKNGVPTSSSYQNLQHAFSFGVGQGYNSLYGAEGFHDGSLGGLAKVCSPEGPAFSVTSCQALLDALSLLQQKIQQLQAVVQLMAQGNGQSVAQQQALTAGVTAVISQLVAATAGMLQQSAEVTNDTMAADLQVNRLYGGVLGFGFNTVHQSGLGNGFGTALGSAVGSSHGNFVPIGGGSAPVGGGVEGVTSVGGGVATSGLGIGGQNRICSPQNSFPPSLGHGPNNSLVMDVGMNGNLGVGSEGAGNPPMVHNTEHLQGSLEEHDTGMCPRDEDDDGEGENLPPGSYELVEMDDIEILAEHTHFCEICGKGFKRDANLRMHMRGHGDEYKTPAALARPDKSSHEASLIRLRRYSCPYVGCKRNKKHRKFQPLKTMLCVKNHYRRSHCPKLLTCSKCKTKKFSVVADLKTHEKHCGRDKWQCSCGTTFSRKDKLFGHIGLFVGHTPALPHHEMEGSGGGDSGTNGSGGFTTANSSAASHGGKESAYMPGSGCNHFGHGNRPLIGAALVAGNCSVMEVGNGNVSNGGGLQSLRSRGGSLSLSDDSNGAPLGDASPSPDGLAGSLVPGSSMFQGLMSSNFLQQANGNTQDSTDVFR